MTGRSVAVLNYTLAAVGAGVTYLMMVADAAHVGHWTHLLTLTPLMPYLVATGLAYRHSDRAGFGGVVVGLIVVTAAVGWPLFWRYYVPADVRPATKVVIKIILPVIQGVAVLLAGAVLEVIRAGGSRSGGQ